jgi:hypothetical protein
MDKRLALCMTSAVPADAPRRLMVRARLDAVRQGYEDRRRIDVLERGGTRASGRPDSVVVAADPAAPLDRIESCDVAPGASD